MNLSAAPLPACSAPASAHASSPTGATAHRDLQPGRSRGSAADRGRFERLMNEKSGSDDDESAGSADGGSDGCGISPGGRSSGGAAGDDGWGGGGSGGQGSGETGGAFWGMLPPLPGLGSALSQDSLAGLAGEGAAGGSAAACAAAQAEMNSTEDPQGIGPPPDQTFEVSVQESMGIAVAVQATRAQGAPGAADNPAWTLSISSPVVDASVLNRHVPRLNERLQARGATHSHIRIEEATEQSDERDDGST